MKKGCKYAKFHFKPAPPFNFADFDIGTKQGPDDDAKRLDGGQGGSQHEEKVLTRVHACTCVSVCMSMPR